MPHKNPTRASSLGSLWYMWLQLQEHSRSLGILVNLVSQDLSTSFQIILTLVFSPCFPPLRSLSISQLLLFFNSISLPQNLFSPSLWCSPFPCPICDSLSEYLIISFALSLSSIHCSSEYFRPYKEAASPAHSHTGLNPFPTLLGWFMVRAIKHLYTRPSQKIASDALQSTSRWIYVIFRIKLYFADDGIFRPQVFKATAAR